MIKNFKNENLNNGNAYLVIDKNNNAILFDTAIMGEAIVNYIKENKINLTTVFITHSHYDHLIGLEMIINNFNPTIYIGFGDYENLFDPNKNLSKSRNLDWKLDENKKIIPIEKDTTLKINEFEIKCIPYGGHTKGTTFYILDKQYIFVGDTLFKDRLGLHKTELGTDIPKFFESLKWLWKNTDDLTIMPGHGIHEFMKKDIDLKIHPIKEVL